MSGQSIIVIILIKFKHLSLMNKTLNLLAFKQVYNCKAISTICNSNYFNCLVDVNGSTLFC